MFGDQPYIECYGRLDDEHWEKDFSDKLFSGWAARSVPVWSHLQVKASDVARLWPFSDHGLNSTASVPIPNLLPTRNSDHPAPEQINVVSWPANGTQDAQPAPASPVLSYASAGPQPTPQTNAAELQSTVPAPIAAPCGTERRGA